MTIDRDEEGRGQGHSFTHTKKVENALHCTETTQNYNMANRKYVKYNLRSYFHFCFSKSLPLPPPNPPLLSLSYWPSVSVTVTTQLKQLST